MKSLTMQIYCNSNNRCRCYHTIRHTELTLTMYNMTESNEQKITLQQENKKNDSSNRVQRQL